MDDPLRYVPGSNRKNGILSYYFRKFLYSESLLIKTISINKYSKTADTFFIIPNN